MKTIIERIGKEVFKERNYLGTKPTQLIYFLQNLLNSQTKGLFFSSSQDLVS